VLHFSRDVFTYLSLTYHPEPDCEVNLRQHLQNCLFTTDECKPDFLLSEETFTQQQNAVVSPVSESLIWLHSHTVQLFTKMTTTFNVQASQLHSLKGCTV